MAEFHYKAFISYSHSDKQWAEWLHRALETYRVPKYLVGRETAGGRVPARVAPVFRDRDELPTAANLTEKIVEALQRSEFLIVICSPAAAASRWTNEEIRQFKALGRSQKILCMIVDGDPASTSGKEACFPQALFDEEEKYRVEPLAADPRDWADGKRLTRLKLVSGLIGVRLDELRQRELQRLRRRQALVTLALVASLTLVITTIMSRVSERHEREKAEQLATFVVDLGERLQSDVDVETLAIINAQASRYLEGLDPRRLSLETSVRVGLAIRQLGYVSEYQGRPEDAIAAYERSRELFLDLHHKHPEDQLILFELAQVQWYVGHFHFQRGDYAKVRAPWEAYEAAARELIRLDPENPEWRVELSYALTSLASLVIDGSKGMDAKTLENLDEAVKTIELAMQKMPDGDNLLGEYANTLAWVADARMRACEPNEAMAARQKTLELALRAIYADPSNNDLKLKAAYAYSGVAGIHTDLGLLAKAQDNLRSSLAILRELAAADPSNVILQYEVTIRQFRLIKILGEAEPTEETLLEMQKIGALISLDEQENLRSGALPEDYLAYLSAWADMQYRAGLGENAASTLRQAMDYALAARAPEQLNPAEQQELSLIRYQWWEVSGQDPVHEYPSLSAFENPGAGEYRSCRNAEINARLAVIRGEPDVARSHARFLQEKGFRDPVYLRFCTRHELCG